MSFRYGVTWSVAVALALPTSAVTQDTVSEDDIVFIEVPERARTAPGPLLSEEDCRFIADYDARPLHPSFIDQFVHMTTVPDFCFEDGPLQCRFPLLRREDPPIVYFDLSSHDFGNFDIMIENLAYTMDFLYQETGITVGMSRNVWTPDVDEFLRILVINESGTATNEDIEGNTVNFGLADFQEAENIPCMAHIYTIEQGAIVSVDIWIKENLEPTLFAQCVKEEIYQSYGIFGDPLGDGALFDDDFGRGPSLGYPLFEPFSIRDEVMLRLLYSDELEPGSNADAIRQTVSGLIENYCPA